MLNIYISYQQKLYLSKLTENIFIYLYLCIYLYEEVTDFQFLTNVNVFICATYVHSFEAV
jgi:hypothetical protein